MKLKYLFLTAALFAGLFTACDDSGLQSQEDYAAYDMLPKICDESDTIRLASTGALFYCKNGFWLEVGVIIPTGNSSSSTTTKPTSSSSKQIESSDDEAVTESSDSEGEECTDRKCGDSSSSKKGNKPNSESSTNPNSTDSDQESSSSTQSLDPYFSFLSDYLTWDKNSGYPILKSSVSIADFEQLLQENNFSTIDLSSLMEGQVKYFAGRIGASNDLGDYVSFFVSKVQDGTNTVSYYIAGPKSDANVFELGKYEGDIEDVIAIATAYDPSWPTGYKKGSLWSINSDAYQVQVPERQACDQASWDAVEEYGYCYETTGGWWWATTSDKAFPGTSGTITPSTTDASGNIDLITTDNTTGEIAENGNLIEGKGLQVTLATKGKSPEEPGYAAIGFYWKKNESAVNISDNRGFCIAYSWEGDKPLQMILEWDWLTYGEDYFYYNLQPGIKVIDIPWSSFKRDGWDKTNVPHWTATEAAQVIKALTFKLMNFDTDEISGTFRLAALGWYGECN